MKRFIKKIKPDKIFISTNDSIETKFTKIIVYTCITFGLVIFFIAFIIFSSILEKKETIKVPNVIGLKLPDAMKIMQDNFLYVNVIQINSEDIKDKDYVVNQNKKEGATVKEGYTVILSVSKGPAIEKVPNFIGWSIDEADAYMNGIDSFLKIKKPVGSVISDQPIGTILSQSPSPDTEIFESTDVGFFVSAGVANTIGVAQNYVGKNYVTVLKSLANRNITFNFTSTAQQDNAVPLNIVSQNLKEGDNFEKATGYKFIITEPKWKGVRKAFGIMEFNLNNFAIPVEVRVEKQLLGRGKMEYFTTNSYGGKISFPYFDDAGTIYRMYVAGKLFSEEKISLND